MKFSVYELGSDLKKMLKPSLKVAAFFLFASVWTACATYSTYTCPDPIGEIVRQDCDDYKVRYESLQASLSVSIGSVSVGGSLGHEQLRDPSELIQMMMHQTLALCHDYNACRVKNEEFSRRREEMDRTFTAVMAILDQLKARNLSDSERRVLLGELVAILKPPSRTQPETRTPKDTKTAEKPKSKWKSNPFRKPSLYWLNSSHNAPGGPAEGEPPKLVWVNASSSDKKLTSGFSAYLWGKLAADDDVKAVGADGFSHLCKVSIKRDQPLSYVSCSPARGKKMPRLDALRMKYTSGVDAKDYDLGAVAPMLKAADNKVWLAYQADPIDRDPVVRERPWLIMVTRIRGWHQFTARCRKDGKPVKIGKSSVLRGRAHLSPYRVLGKDILALPFTLPHGKDAYEPEEGDMSLKDAKGQWKCKLKLDGTTVREVTFRIKADGIPELHPQQKDSRVISPWWLVDTKVIPNGFEDNHGNS